MRMRTVRMYKENRWDAKQLVGSGGMPSSHSATVTALAVAIGLQEGFGSSLFTTVAIFSSVVMYDASGVRLHSGKQAELFKMEDVSMGMWVGQFIATVKAVEYIHSLRFCQFGCVDDYLTTHYQSSGQMACF
ncbi:hypothetical protein ABZP36_009622 [Zizania latifolia]